MINFNKDELLELASEIQSKLSIKDRKYFCLKYPKTFTGSDFTKCCLQHNTEIFTNKKDVIDFGTLLIQGNIIRNSYFYHKFYDDENSWYVFNQDFNHRGKLAFNQNGSEHVSWANLFSKLSDKGKQNEILSTNLLTSNELHTFTDFIDKKGQEEDLPLLLFNKFNSELLDQVRPIKWIDPEVDGKYNMLVIGGGTGGMAVSGGCGVLGGKTCMIERKLFGGDCLNTGCVPSKALLKIGKMCHDVKTKSKKFGITINGTVEFDFQEAMNGLYEKRTKISYHDSPHKFMTKYGVEIFLGEAQFTGPNSVSINGKELKFVKACIATGSRPRIPNISGIDKIHYYTSDNIFNLQKLPEHLVVIGGGPIGSELSQAFRRMGSKVTILIRSGKFLPKEDPDAGLLMEGVFEEEGIEFIKNFTFKEVRPLIDLDSVDGAKNECEIVVKKKDGEEICIKTDCLLIATGRIPNVENIGLEKAGVKFDLETGIKLNDNYKTTNKNIYAVGDCTTQEKFTHMAYKMGESVIYNAFIFKNRKVSDIIVPRVTYTDPEVAQVGLNVQELDQQGIKYDTWMSKMDGNDRAICDGETKGFIKVHTAQGSDKILGGVIICSRAGEMINDISLAMHKKFGLKTFVDITFPYPTYGETLREVAQQKTDTTLTRFVRGFYAKSMNWKRS